MRLQRVPIAMDLSETALEDACNLCAEPQRLVVSTALIAEGERLTKQHTFKHLSLRLFVDTDLQSDEWFVEGPYSGVFSPGV